MTITYTANMTCGFSESVRDLDQIFVTGYRFLGEVGDGPELTATESDGCDTDGDGLEDKDELGERVALSDSLAGRIATIFSDISEMEAENTEVAFEWESDPTKADTDDDGANDRKERTDVGDNSNDLPSNVKAPDVVHVFPATDESFRDQHDDFSRDGYSGYKGYVNRIIDNTNDALEDEFSDKDPTPHLVITTNEDGEWGEWLNQPAGFSTESETVYAGVPLTGIEEVEAEDVFFEQNQMRSILEWPVDSSTGELDRRGADVLSGFSGQPMGDPGDAIRDRVAGQFIDAVSGTAEGEEGRGSFSTGKYDDDYELTGGVTLIGTDDPATNARTVDNYYMHELGHVLGAIHPKDDDGDGTRFEVPSGTEGVMCKTSCASINVGLEAYIEQLILNGREFELVDEEDPDPEWIINSMSYSRENEHRIINIDYDFKDDEDIENPLGSTNEARNLATVATAASTDPPPENTP